MAATDSAIPVNGSYAPQNFEANNYSASSANSTAGYSASQQQEGSQAGSSAATSEIPKDEVGWYFVEQYYTTLSKSPDKLYLFYNKRSQFVSGTEEDKVNVCVGQKAINDRIKELDFHDTKVRVTNVDSQGSDANIVIQVIGEISNRGQPHKRFVQTFVLAAQTNGYFVLNDIFRYLAEEPEEEEELQHDPTAPAAGVQEPVTTSALPEAETEVTPSEDALTKVDQKLEDAVDEEPTREASPPPAAVNGTPVPEDTEVVEAEETPAAAVSTSEEALSEEAPSKEPDAPVVEEEAEPEKPKDPAPTPAPAAPKAAPVATPAAPPKPAAPRTWASLAASAHRVAMPAIPASVAQPPSQAKPAAPAPSQPLAVPAQTSTPGREPSPANSQGDSSGWQTAGPKKEPARVQNQASVEAEPKRAYIKNVYSQVEEGSLRSVLSKFGDIEYLDISRPKNCAFVDFKTAAGYQNAISNNPHIVNGIEVKVEERRPRPQQPFYPRGGAPRGRGGIGGQPRGGFQHRGRGGPVGRGGRGAPQEA